MTSTTTAVAALITALSDRGYRAEVFPADPPHTKVDAAIIWYDPHDHYPSDTVWAPYENDGWEWGRNFEHQAPAGLPVSELADRVLATLEPRE